MEIRHCAHIGEREVGDGHPIYIVFEAGPTHDGLETAKKLVDVAAACGADAIKFQIIDSEKLVPDPKVMFTYQRLVDKETGQTEEVTEPLVEILKRRELTYPQWEELIAYCRKKEIDFFSTATNQEEVEFLRANGIDTVKVCSGDVTFHAFLRLVASYDWAVQIDTGSSTLGEIEAAVDVLEGSGCRNIIINHCPSGYPARLESINLRVISTLQRMFPYPVAFSDHSPGYEMDIAAAALGAHMLEKTITLDRTIRSPEHIMSLEPPQARDFVRAIRELEVALGDFRRLMTPEERQKNLVARRSLFTARELRKGEVLDQNMIEYCRPGHGIPANLDYLVLGRKIKKDLRAGTLLSFAHLE